MAGSGGGRLGVFEGGAPEPGHCQCAERARQVPEFPAKIPILIASQAGTRGLKRGNLPFSTFLANLHLQ